MLTPSRPAAASAVPADGPPQAPELRASGATAVGYWAVLVLALVVPVTAIVVVLFAVPDEVTSLAPPAEPLVVPVRTVDVDGGLPATATLTWGDGLTIVAPGWSGLVSAVLVAPGEEVVSGSVLATVDGVDRVAVATPRPFHRALADGDRGPDVAMLRTALAALGHPAEPVAGNDSFDSPLGQAVRSLEMELAHVDAAGAGEVFHPEWFGWLPDRAVRVQEVALTAGAPAPAAGEPIVVGPPTLASLAVTVSATSQLEDEQYEFRYGEAAVLLGDGLSAGGAAVSILAATLTPGVESIEGRIRLAKPRPAMVVPVTAVEVDAEGSQCVLRVVGDGYQAVAVTVDGGGVGTAEVTGGIAVGDQVLANPAQLGLTCG